MPIWVNNDGLVIKTGVAEAELANVAGYTTDGPLRMTEIVLNYEDMPAVDDGVTIINDNVKIPKGAVISEVKINKPLTAFDSAADGMILQIGTIDADRTSNGDTAALVAAATQTELNAGGTNVAGWVGAGVNKLLTSAKLLTWEQDTAVATDGLTTIEVYWFIPKTEAETLVYSK